MPVTNVIVQVPRNYWKDHGNHKQFFDHLAKQLGIQQHKDWYNVENNTNTLVKTYGGGGLLKRYKGSNILFIINDQGSLYYALKTVYPEYNWIPWKFRGHHVPRGFWQHSSNHKLFLEWLAGHLNIKTPEDWYQITTSQVQSNGGTSLLNLYEGINSLECLLMMQDHCTML